MLTAPHDRNMTLILLFFYWANYHILIKAEANAPGGEV